MITGNTIQEKYREFRENGEDMLPCERCGKVLTQTPLCSVCERRELEAAIEDKLYEIFYQVVPLYHPLLFPLNVIKIFFGSVTTQELSKWLCVQFRRDGFTINVLIDEEEAVKDFPGLYLDDDREKEIKGLVEGVLLTIC